VTWLQAIVLGIVEGLTEFLPVSSTGHLTIVEQLMGLSTDDAGVTAFTAIVQVGAILAVIGYFRSDIGRLVLGFLRGLRNRSARRGQAWREACVVVVGSVPIGVVGLLTRDLVSGPLRSLWVVAVALVAWSAVMVAAERLGRQNRPESSVGLRDAVVMGAFQCIALVPGVSRSGATISAGLFRGLDRVAATRISFLLSIPALLAAGGLEAVSEGGAVADSVGWGPTLLATLVSLVVGYASIAWLLRLVAGHPITVFVPYRIALGVVLAVALATGAIAAT
jgi:undecaprenyl-diphosphatase